MRNRLNLLLLVLLVGCLPLCGQDATNATAVDTNAAFAEINVESYRQPAVETNAPGYGNPALMPGRPMPPPSALRPRRAPQLGMAPQAIPPGMDTGPAQPMAPTATPVAPRPVRIYNSPIPRSGGVAPARWWWTIEVCTNADDLANGCLDTGLRQAEGELWELYDQEYRLGRHAGDLKVVLPAGLSPAQQMLFLFQVETNVIELVRLKLISADRVFYLRLDDTPQIRQQKQASQAALHTAVQMWATKAQSEAGAGSNWGHDWSANAYTFVFRGPAYEQFAAISAAIRGESSPGGGRN